MRVGCITIILFFCLNIFLLGQSKNNTLPSDTTYKLNEFVVMGTRYGIDVKHIPMTISVINRSDIEKTHEQSLLPILTEQVPGFFSTSRGILGYGVSTGAAGGMSLRGIGGTPTTGLLVLIDGHPQYMGLMGHPIADAYQTMLADKVEVLRGPASTLYGSNAMGGVINIVTRKSKIDGVKNNLRLGYGSYNTLITEVANSIREGKFNSTVTASYNRSDGHRKDMEFEQYGGYLKLGYDISSKWNVFADINVTHFNASNPGSIETPIYDNDSRITRGMTSLSLDNKYSITSGSFKFFYNWGRHKINDGYGVGEEPLDYRFNAKDAMFGITWYQNIHLWEESNLIAGFDYQNFGGKAWNYFNVDKHKEEISDKTEDDIAGYLDFRHTFAKIITINAGIRLDHHSHTGTEWVPQGGVSLQLPKNIDLKATVSKGFRNPTIRELYMFRPANPELLPERLWNYELSFSQSIMDAALSYGINLFYINGDNMIQTLPVDGRPLNINTGKVENWGIEASSIFKINQTWRLSANYSWIRMIHPVLATPEHKLYAGVDFSKGKWNISSGLQYINGLFTEIGSELKENFLLLNVRGSFQFHKVANFYIKGENLLAQRYEINRGYPMPKATIITGINLSF